MIARLALFALLAAADGPAVERGHVAVGNALADLAERVRPAVVHVRGTLGERTRATGQVEATTSVSVGSGFLVDRDGTIVTNEHVVRGVIDLRVRLYDGREFPACVVGLDELADIALLQIEPKGPVPVLPLANSDRVRVGEVVLAIGSPFGFAHSVTAGIVSAPERVVDQEADKSSESSEPPYSFYIQTDASINVGNSGGPLIDGHGAVIGVNAAFWGGPQPAQGVGFAIPANVVKILLPQLRAGGVAPRSYLGVESQPLTPDLAKALHLASLRGALLASVEKGSAAEAAGMEVGDVVTNWGGHGLVTRDDFRIFAQLTPPATRVHVELLRAGRLLEKTVTTRAATAPAQLRHAVDCRLHPVAAAYAFGFEVVDLPRARLTELPGGHGAQVAHVQGGAARDANLQVGDIILRAGNAPVANAAELKRLLDAWKREAPLPLLVRTRSHTFWTALPTR